MTERVYLQTFFYVWIVIIIGTGVFYVAADRDWALAFFLGSISSVMLMSHNYKTTMKVAYKDPEALKKRAIKNYFFRYLFYIIITVYIYFRKENVLHVIPMFLGFASFKFVMLANFFIHRKEVNEDD